MGEKYLKKRIRCLILLGFGQEFSFPYISPYIYIYACIALCTLILILWCCRYSGFLRGSGAVPEVPVQVLHTVRCRSAGRGVGPHQLLRHDAHRLLRRVSPSGAGLGPSAANARTGIHFAAERVVALRRAASAGRYAPAVGTDAGAPGARASGASLSVGGGTRDARDC